MFPGLTFGSPWCLWGLLALPVLAGLFVWSERQASVRMARLIQTPRLRTQLTGAASAGRRRVRYGLFLLALAALLVALAAPRAGYETRETHRRGLDLMVIVDVSKSMLATDLPPSRLARAKLAVQDFVTGLEGDRVGLVAFAGTAFVQAPMTVDYDAVLNTVNELDTDLIPRGGTNLGAAIDTAVDAFGKAEAGNRAILLLSDGEPTSDDDQAGGVKAATRAAEAGVRIYTLGFGTPEGSLIPLGGGNFVRDADGQIVRTKLDEKTLSAIANAGNGFYVRFNGDAAIRTVVEKGLSQLKAGEINAGQARRPIERYQWPLGAGLLLLTAAGFLSERRQTRAPLSPGPRAVPAARPAPANAAVMAALLFALLPPGTVRAEDSSAPSAAPSTGQSAMDLYKAGKYDEAYKAFEALAEKNPEQGSLQFNAGASAYMGKQYDEALNAFGRAMTSDNPDLQAKANYNFGNTLFRQGEGKKTREEIMADWNNALQHYDAALKTQKARDPKGESPLSRDLAYNQKLVKERLEVLKKEPPPSKDSQKDKQDKKDQQNKQDQQNQRQQGQGGQDSKQDQNKQDGNQPPKPDPSQQKEDQQGKGQPGQDQSQGPSGQQPPQQDSGGKPGEPKPGQEGNQPPQPSPGASGKDQDSPGEKKPSGEGSPPDNPPEGKEDKPREHGDFQAKPDGGASPGQSPGGNPDQKASGQKASDQTGDQPGKMNAAQARSLLDSLKDEDAHVTLGDPAKRHHSRDEPPLKDW